jgi:hypothetical protein
MNMLTLFKILSIEEYMLIQKVRMENAFAFSMDKTTMIELFQYYAWYSKKKLLLKKKFIS